MRKEFYLSLLIRLSTLATLKIKSLNSSLTNITRIVEHKMRYFKQTRNFPGRVNDET